MQLRRLISEIPVSDVARSVAFYRDHLGFEVLHEEDDFAMLERDEQRLDVSRREGFGVKLWLVVSDIKALHEHLSGLDGVEVSDIVPRHYWVWEFELVDPDGTRLMVVQPPPAPGLDIPEIFEAIVEGDEDGVAEAISEDRMSAIETTGPYWGWVQRSDWSTIQVAAGAGTPYILEMVLEAGADPTGGERPDPTWWSPIHFAALRNPDLVDRLIQAGATVDACTAAAMGWLDKLEGLALDNGSGDASPLHFAAGRGQAAAVEWLLKQDGVTADSTDGYYGMTPWEWAGWAGDDADAVRALLPEPAE